MSDSNQFELNVLISFGLNTIFMIGVFYFNLKNGFRLLKSNEFNKTALNVHYLCLLVLLSQFLEMYFVASLVSNPDYYYICFITGFTVQLFLNFLFTITYITWLEHLVEEQNKIILLLKKREIFWKIPMVAVCVLYLFIWYLSIDIFVSEYLDLTI